MKHILCSLRIAARTTCAFVLTMSLFALLPAVATAQTSFVTSVNLVDGNLRNDVDIWLGYQFTVGAEPITVTEVGRWVVAGNTNVHTVKLVLASTGADVSGGSAQVVTAGATAGEFKYAPLADPVALEANTAYYIVSQETEAGDQWYNDGVSIAHTDVATIEHAIWRTEGGWNPGGTPDFGYGPLSFKYVAGSVGDVSVTGVSVAPTSAELAVGGTQQLTATVAPANATNSTVSWSSSDMVVATVDSTGLVTAVAVGEATITVTTADGGYTAACTVEVTDTSASVTVPVANTYAIRKAAATGVMAIDISSEHPGGFYQSYLRDFRTGLFVFQMPDLDRPITSVTFNAYHKDNVVTTYSVSLFGHDSISSLDSVPSSLETYWGYGLAANQPGTELITNLVGAGSTQNDLGWVTADVTDFVRDHFVPGRYLILRVGSTFDAPTDAEHESLHPTGRIYFDGGPGAVTRNQVPYLTITTAGDIVSVTGVSVLPADVSLPMGTSQQLVATVTPGDASYRAVIWSSSDTAVATVSGSGLVSGINAGDATITATTVDGGFVATSNVTVTVANVAVTGVSVSPTGASKRVGTTEQLTATVAPANATNQTVSWSSNDPAVAAVSSTGLVTAVAAGNATITVTTADGGFTATSSMTITPAPVSHSYPLDANGWSIIAPSADSRLIYVSATGNDGTAQSYTMAQVGSDPANPSITVNAYQTLSTARSQMRVGYPDWLLFKRGDTFTAETNLGGNTVGGRSESERWVFTNYGTSGNRPLLTGAYWSCVGESGNIAIVGLEIYYRMRDPKSDFWVGFASQSRSIFTAIGPITGNILLEDSIFRNGSDNIVMDMDNGLNIELRRCAVWEGYKGTTTETGSAGANADRSQGIYVSGSSGLRIEDCFFDHNGWVQDSAGNLVGFGRSIYSHNIYLANGSNDTVVSGNLITRGAANGLQARSGNYVEDNLFVLNAIAMFSAASSVESDGDEGTINDVYNNVLLAGDDCLPSAWDGIAAGARAWGLEIHRMEEGHYEGNIILDVEDQGSASWAMNCVFNLTSGTDTIKVWNNIVRNWHTTSGASILVESGAASHFDLQNNIVDGVNQTTNEAVTFVDGERTLSTYLTSIGSSGDNLAFLANARAAWLGAPRSYPEAYRASTVNNYFREGFEIDSSNPLPGVSVSPGSVELEVGQNQQLTATVSPPDASQNVTWSSSNPSVATVNSSGLVTAVALGSTTITATAEAGGYTATCSVTVTPGEAVVPFSQTAVVVDGQQDAAYGAELGTISKPAASAEVPATSDISATWRATFDATNLHVLVEVTDNAWTNSVVNDWENDGVELFLDGDNSKGATPDNINDIKIAFVPRADGTVFIQTTVYPPNPSGLDFSGVQAAYTLRLDGEGNYQGYNLEIKVPLAVAGITPEEGWQFGLDFQINDNDDGGARDRVVTWFGTDLNNHPSVYGTATLGSTTVDNSVPSITTTTLPDGTVGTAYSEALAATGGDGTLVWTLDSGMLPEGLSLSPDGVVSGTPAASGTNAFTVKVADSDDVTGSSDEDTEELSITITTGTATVTLGDLSQTYDGTPRVVTVVTTPAGLAYSVTYDGETAPPVNAGSYAVVATVVDPNYMGSAAGVLVVAKAPAVVTLGSLSHTYDGEPHPATVATTPAGLAVSVTYNGSATVPVDAGTYAVVATVSDPNYSGSATGTLTISQAAASITLENLRQSYDGTPRTVTAVTNPSGLAVELTYDGGALAPILPGSYWVEATIVDDNYSGSASGTLVVGITALVRHAPELNAGLDGSLQLLNGEDTTLSGGAEVFGDLLVPGTPTVHLNGKPLYGGTIDGDGASQPSGYTITLKGNVLLRNVVRRIDPIAMPVVDAPPAPSGSASVTILKASQDVSDWSTLRDLTLKNNVGQKVVPPGTYGNFIAHKYSGFTLGVANSTVPSVYNLQNLTLNEKSSLVIVGPVELTLANEVKINGTVGSSDHPEWLVLKIASGGVTLNGSVYFAGSVIAPDGTVTLGANSVLEGEVAADRLILDGKALLHQPAPAAP